jgi:ArsR family transcriptional regulator
VGARERRLQTLRLLGAGERSVSDLAQHVDLSQSALSQHLARLRKARLVSTRREGATIFNRIADHDARTVAKALSALVAKRRGGD